MYKTKIVQKGQFVLNKKILILILEEKKETLKQEKSTIVNSIRMKKLYSQVRNTVKDAAGVAKGNWVIAQVEKLI